MGRWAYFAVLLFFFPVSIYSHDRQKELESLCAWHVCNFEFDDALHCARSLIKTADSTGNDFRKLSAYAFAGQAYMAADKPDSAFIWLCEGLKLWEEDENRYVKTKGYSELKSSTICLRERLHQWYPGR